MKRADLIKIIREEVEAVFENTGIEFVEIPPKVVTQLKGLKSDDITAAAKKLNEKIPSPEKKIKLLDPVPSKMPLDGIEAALGLIVIYGKKRSFYSKDDMYQMLANYVESGKPPISSFVRALSRRWKFHNTKQDTHTGPDGENQRGRILRYLTK